MFCGFFKFVTVSEKIKKIEIFLTHTVCGWPKFVGTAAVGTAAVGMAAGIALSSTTSDRLCLSVCP